MNLKPVSDHIILQTKDEETKTEAGIIIPETVDKERPEQGAVVAVGPGKRSESGQREPMEVSVGDTVIFKKYAPDEVEVNGETYLIIRADDVMAIVQ